MADTSGSCYNQPPNVGIIKIMGMILNNVDKEQLESVMSWLAFPIKIQEIKMEFTCIECETLYDDTDGDTDERMCNKCLDIIYDESLERKSKEQVKSSMNKIDKLIKSFA